MEAPAFALAAVVADAGAQLGCLGETLWAAQTPDELVATVTELESLRSRVSAMEASVLTEVETRKIAKPISGGARPVTGSPTSPACTTGRDDAPCATPPNSPPSCPRRSPLCATARSHPSRPT